MATACTRRQARRFVIAGGGIGGLTLAIFLRRLGEREVVVLEKKASPHTPDRDSHMGLGIWVNALRCLRMAGVDVKALEERGRYMGDSAYLSTEGQVLAKPGTMLQDGHLLFVRKHELIGALSSALPEGFVRYGCTALDYSSSSSSRGAEGGGSVTVKYDVGGGREEEVEADAFVIADGLFSRLTRHPPPCYRGYSVYRGVVNRTVQGDLSFQTWGLASRFASVPLKVRWKNGQVWFGTIVHCHPGFKHPPQEEDLRPFLLDRFHGWHDPIGTLIRETDPSHIIYDDAYAIKEHGSGGAAVVTAIGDAAHGVDPILAQGAGVAIEDAAELASHISTCVGPSSSTSALAEAFRKYEKATSTRARILTAISDVSQTLGQVTWRPGMVMRDSLFTWSPQVVKGAVFDAMIKLSLSRHWGGAWGQDYGYVPTKIDYDGKERG